MSSNSTTPPTSFNAIINRAWPIILANSASPLLGLTDTAVIGRTGTEVSLGAIALGSLIFSFVYWTFGFLRMGTTGLVAQANGSNNEIEVRATLARAALMGCAIGLLLILAQIPIFRLALAIISGSQAVETEASTYMELRIWGAPATLANYALLGALIGLGHSRTLLTIQVVLNAINIVLDILFAGYLGMGVAGIALGTMIAEWSAGILSFILILCILRKRHSDEAPFWPWDHIRDLRRLGRTMLIQLNIMIRTLCLLAGFGWFTQQGARLGDITLAANHILLQFISFSAFFLDGIAYASEALVGAAAGARQIDVFKTLVRKTAVMAGIVALALSAGVFLLGETLIHLLTALDPIRLATAQALPFAAVYILVSFVAFQLDGIYIGVTRTRDMRNAALASLAIYISIDWLLTDSWGNTGVWVAFIGFILARACTLGALYPRLVKAIER